MMQRGHGSFGLWLPLRRLAQRAGPLARRAELIEVTPASAIAVDL
jgi:hypothetical protein